MMRKPRCAWISWALLAALAVGCRSSTHDATNQRYVDSQMMGRINVPAPPGLDTDRLTARTDSAYRRAKMSLDQIIQELSWPDYLPKVDPPPHGNRDGVGLDAQDGLGEAANVELPENKAAAEPPTASQQAYLRGRLAWFDGRMSRAASEFKRALSLSPDSPSILRALGQTYDRLGNKVQAAYFLQQAVALEPTDIDSLNMLGFYAIDQARWETAIATFAYALQLKTKYEATRWIRRQDRSRIKDADPALWPLAHYYLGTALTHAGYDHAAIQQFSSYLNLPDHFARTTTLVQEIAFLRRQRGATWKTIGDAYSRLNRPANAIKAYQMVAVLNPDLADRGFSLLRRLVYVHLCLNQSDRARELVVERLKTDGNEPQLFDLVEYLIELGTDAEEFKTELQSIYNSSDRPSQLAMVIAGLIEPPEAITFLQAHLDYKPYDRIVFANLINRLLPLPHTSSQRDLATAVGVTAATTEASPTVASRYAEILFAANEKSDELMEMLETDPQAASPFVRYLKGQLLANDRQFDRAEREFIQVINQIPTMVAARVSLSRLLIDQGRYKEAARWLEAMVEQDDAEVVVLRVQILTQTGRCDEAMTLLNQIIAQQPQNLDLILSKASLQRSRSDDLAAERTLLKALNMHPDAEKIYERLLVLYGNTSILNAGKQAHRLMRRMFATIPNSRIARLTQAEIHEARRQFDRAEPVARALLEEDDKDYQALALLLKILHRSQRSDQADTLAEQHLAADSDNLQLLYYLYTYFQISGNQNRANDLKEQVLLLQPPSEQRTMLLTTHYLETTSQPEKALALLITVMNGPTQNPTLLANYLVAAAERCNQPGLIESASAVLLELIERHTDQTSALTLHLANFYLGTNQLDKAIELTRKKLQGNVENPMRWTHLHVTAMVRAGQPDQAEQNISDAIVRFPDHAADLSYERAMLFEKRGQHDRAEQAMIELLENFPGHAQTNNGLGYTWTDDGRNLQQALQMILLAVDSDPKNPAYLDSLGWTHYKMGNFDQAVSWLKRAVDQPGGMHPVIMDHLGDAFYRIDNKNRAHQYWTAAIASMNNYPLDDDVELKRVAEQLHTKIEAVANNGEPHIASVPKPEASLDQGPNQPPIDQQVEIDAPTQTEID